MGGLDPRYCQFSPNGQPSYQHNMITIWVAKGFDKHPIIISKKMWLPGTKISTRPIFFERNHSKRVSVENSQGRFQSEISRLLYGFHHHYFFFGSRKKQIPGDDPAVTLFIPGRWRSRFAFDFGHVFTHHPKKVTVRRIARLMVTKPLFLFDFVGVFWGSETSFDSMFFLRLPKKTMY